MYCICITDVDGCTKIHCIHFASVVFLSEKISGEKKSTSKITLYCNAFNFPNSFLHVNLTLLGCFIHFIYLSHILELFSFVVGIISSYVLLRSKRIVLSGHAFAQPFYRFTNNDAIISLTFRLSITIIKFHFVFGSLIIYTLESRSPENGVQCH